MLRKSGHQPTFQRKKKTLPHRSQSKGSNFQKTSLKEPGGGELKRKGTIIQRADAGAQKGGFSPSPRQLRENATKKVLQRNDGIPRTVRIRTHFPIGHNLPRKEHHPNKITSPGKFKAGTTSTPAQTGTEVKKKKQTAQLSLTRKQESQPDKQKEQKATCPKARTERRKQTQRRKGNPLKHHIKRKLNRHPSIAKVSSPIWKKIANWEKGEPNAKTGKHAVPKMRGGGDP